MQNTNNKAFPVSIIPCLDLRGGRVVKGIRFVDLRDAGDPVESAVAYCEAGADALTLLDITATIEGRGAMLDVVRRVAEVSTVPLTVGGGIGDPGAAEKVLAAGADRVSIGSAALRSPGLIEEMLHHLGRQKVVVSIDVDKNPQLASGYEIYVDGGRTATGRDAIEWIRRLADMGVRTILPTSKTADGSRAGYDLRLIKTIAGLAPASAIIASGGAGEPQHFKQAAEVGAKGLLAASVFHFGLISIPELKQYLAGFGIKTSVFRV